MSNDTAAIAVDRPLRYGPPLTLAQAKAVMDAAEAEVIADAWPVAVVVADSSGDVVLAMKLDHMQHSSLAIARASWSRSP